MKPTSLTPFIFAIPAVVLAGLPLAPASATPTVSLLLPYNGASSTYFASVITTLPTGTAYAVTCAPLPASASASAIEEGDYCGPEFTITQGPSLWEFAFTVVGEETLSARCEGDIENTKELTCTQSVGGESLTDSETGIETTTMQPSDYESVIGVVTVTAGAELLTGGGASASETAAASESASVKASSKSASLTKITGTASPTGSATGASVAPTSTGAAGMNMVQQGAVVGAAGVVLAALAL